MGNEELITDLKSRIQELEDAKTQLSESQERLREVITMLEMTKECEGCHRPFSMADLFETPHGYLCQDCCLDREEIEEKEIYE